MLILLIIIMYFLGQRDIPLQVKIIEFNYASPEVVTANPALLRAIL